MKLGLAAIDAVCERLGRPERAVPSVLIAGTNGKGSVAATLAAIAAAGGRRAGLYTSPHLQSVHERIRADGRDVEDDELEAALGQVFRSADRAPEVPLTYFEAITAAAFVTFATRRVDVAVLEVGLGGRFDATNVSPARLSVVSSIGLDHTEELGGTLEAIAREKAGVFRSGRPALIGRCDEEARRELADAASRTGAEFHDAASEVSVSRVETSLAGTTFRVETPGGAIDLATPLPGRHQAWNAALAVRAAELLAPETAGLDAAAIRRGVAGTRWPGRLEAIRVGGRTVLLDGCHNPQAADALATFLEDAGLAGRARLVFGAMADKDVEAMAARLFPSFASVHLVTAPSARAATAGELASRVRAWRADASPRSGLAEALRELLTAPEDDLRGRDDHLRRRNDDPAPIIVAGSLYLVGEARAYLLSRRLEDA